MYAFLSYIQTFFQNDLFEYQKAVQDSFYKDLSEYQSRVNASTQPTFQNGVLPLGSLDFFNNQNIVAIIYGNVLYFLIVFILTLIMKNCYREGFQMLNFMRIYNLLCVCLAGYVVVGVINHKIYYAMGTFVCNDFDVTSQPGRQLAYVLWIYYIQKYFEFLDTFVMILRKRWRQVSFLHLYHHSSITFVTAAFITFDINGDSYLAALCNSFIHVCMYGHYFLASFGVKTWWKRYLTMMQLVQFIICWFQSLYALLLGSNCGYGTWLKILMIAYQTSMFVLFMQFYFKSYSKRRSLKGDKRKEN